MNTTKKNRNFLILFAALSAVSPTIKADEQKAQTSSSWIGTKLTAIAEYFNRSKTSKPTMASHESTITLDELSELSPDDIKVTSLEAMKGWNNIIFSKMTPNQTKALSRAQLQALDEQQTQGLQVKHLTDDQITAVNTAYLLPSQAKFLLPYLSPEQISALSPLTFGSLPKEKLDKALNRFNIAQLETIEAAFKKSSHPFVNKIKNIIALKRSK